MGLFGKSRGQKKADAKLGYISERQTKPSTGRIHTEVNAPIGLAPIGPSEVMKKEKHREYRSAALKNIMSYFNDTAYDHLQDWHKANMEESYVPIRKRKPFMRYNIPKILATRVSSKLVGRSVFPTLTIQEDPEAEYYFREIMKRGGIDYKLVGPVRGLVARGSMFVRFHIIAGVKFKLEAYDSNFCYPVFNPDDTLGMVTVCHTYTDQDDLDDKGNPKRKWYKAEFGEQADVLYDNPEWKANVEPEFTEVERVEHGLGFVQGEWFRTDEQDLSTPDGMSLVEDAISFQDAINYSLSQSQMATDYNTDPQLGIKGMDSDEIENLIRSSTKAWNLGREGDGHFIESSMNGVTASMEMRDKNRTMIQDLTRVILMDPEKMTATAQSGKAMEVLHGPFVDLVNELRPQLESHMIALVIKMGVANLIAARQSGQSPVPVPPGWFPKSANIAFNWPPVFEMTTQDLQALVTLVTTASNNNIISRRTGVQMVAKYFNIEDIDAELNEINTQPQLNPFGAF